MWVQVPSSWVLGILVVVGFGNKSFWTLRPVEVAFGQRCFSKVSPNKIASHIRHGDPKTILIPDLGGAIITGLKPFQDQVVWGKRFGP